MSVNAEFFRGNPDNKRKPPSVKFSKRARFDQSATDRKGMSVYVDEDVVEVTSPSGDVVQTKPVHVWFADISKEPAYFEWIPTYQRMYEAWQKANDVASVDGVHVKNWPLASPAQVETLMHAGLSTIEAVSNMPDELAAAIDGGKYLRSKARYFVNAAEDIGQIASRAAVLEAENETLRSQVEELSRKFNAAKKETERLEQHFSGKEGYDVIAGRVEPVGLRVVHSGNVAPVTAESAPVIEAPQASGLKPMSELSELNMSELREYCYENDIKPSNSREETLKRIEESGQVE